MRIPITRWMHPELKVCPLCGSQGGRSDAASAFNIPVRHPGPRAVLASLCSSCREVIPWITAPVCRTCGRPEACGDCARPLVRHFEICRSAVRYNSVMKDLLALYKYRGNESLESVMAAMLAFAYEQLQRELSRQGSQSYFPVITSVPLARERLEDRGFNQAEQMAVRVADWYGLTYVPMLTRLFHTEKQSLKDRRSRTTDMRGIFALTSETPPMAMGASVLLIDDIYTTGSTINECARILRPETASTKVYQPLIYGLQWARS
jgi:competence protein ComFC